MSDYRERLCAQCGHKQEAHQWADEPCSFYIWAAGGVFRCNCKTFVPWPSTPYST